MNAVVAPRATDVAPVTDSTSLIAAIARAASDPQVDIDKMRGLFDMHRQMVKDDAERQFVMALTEFKLNPPDIVKGKQVRFGQTSYSHATLANVCAAVIDGLSRHGIAHRWKVEQPDGKVKVTCILTHRAGHSEATEMIAPPDSSGQKNAVQQIASAVTYLQRYTLLAATGLSTRDQTDDDGRMSGDSEPTITQQQALDLETMIRDAGKDLSRFKAWAKVDRLTDILAKNYQTCVDRVREVSSARR